jgi:hypothetical protein
MFINPLHIYGSVALHDWVCLNESLNRIIVLYCLQLQKHLMRNTSASRQTRPETINHLTTGDNDNASLAVSPILWTRLGRSSWL